VDSLVLPAALLPFLAPRLGPFINEAARRLPGPLTEVRLRSERPIHLLWAGGDGFLRPDGRAGPDPAGAVRCDPEELTRTLQLMTQGSLYAWEEEIRSGFLTLPGGHRVGLVGRALVDGGAIRTLQPISGLNLRIARSIHGVASTILPALLDAGRPCSTLLIGPPGSGKTTLLRDLCRLLSLGAPALGLPGQKVGVVDERSEIGGAVGGVPTHDLGPRTDLLDGAPKASGLMLLIRSMSPQVLAVDELGRPEEGEAVREALHAGVSMLATAHGRDLADVARRPTLASLIEDGAFRRAVILRGEGPPGGLAAVHHLGAAADGEAI
jgi:stage III sporulation protein AA